MVSVSPPSIWRSVEDQRLRAGQEGHRRGQGGAGELDGRQAAQLEDADVAGQDLDLADAEVLAGQRSAQGGPLLVAEGSVGIAGAAEARIEANLSAGVAGEGLQIVGEGGGQLVGLVLAVAAAAELLQQLAGGALAGVGVQVVPAQPLGQPLDGGLPASGVDGRIRGRRPGQQHQQQQRGRAHESSRDVQSTVTSPRAGAGLNPAECRIPGETPAAPAGRMRAMSKAHLDETDRRLLSELRADGRLTHVALAARVGLSRSAVQERVARLERAGVIRGYTVRLADPGDHPGVRAYLLIRGGASHERAVKMLAGFPEVRVADSVSGDIDLVLQVEGERIEDINRIRDEVAKLPGIVSTQTLLVMNPRFDRR